MNESQFYISNEIESLSRRKNELLGEIKAHQREIDERNAAIKSINEAMSEIVKMKYMT